ncbi:uncharacterized protein METZ01_LOCUS168825, partial [marine metagenome]
SRSSSPSAAISQRRRSRRYSSRSRRSSSRSGRPRCSMRSSQPSRESART